MMHGQQNVDVSLFVFLNIIRMIHVKEEKRVGGGHVARIGEMRDS
jgi:hypothetical protein